jgi:hypothetical protein
MHIRDFGLSLTIVSGVLKKGLGNLTPLKLRVFAKVKPNSQFCGIYIRKNLITYGFHSFANGVELLTRGLSNPDSHSLCPLTSTEFVDPQKILV